MQNHLSFRWFIFIVTNALYYKNKYSFCQFFLLHLCVSFSKHYITLSDYLPVIQSNQLNDQILEDLQGGVSQRKFTERWAMSKCKSLIGDKYDLDLEFTDTLPYDYNKNYNAGDRVIIDYPEWESEKQYSQFDFIVYENNGYFCLQTNNDEIFDVDKWQGVGSQYSIWHIPYPYPYFNLEIQESKNSITAGYYKVGDKVCFGKNIYTCKIETRLNSHIDTIQLQSYSELDFVNVFPNDPINGKSFWTDEGEYFVEKNIFPSEPVEGQDIFWIEEDNRDELILQTVIDLSLWQLHKRISPQMIPVLRESSFHAAMKYLEDISVGKQESDIMTIQPSQGNSFSFGSKPKNHNGWQ